MLSVLMSLALFVSALCVKRQTTIEEFPFLVSIRRNIIEIENFTAVHVCSGVLITSYQVLTTASCLHDALGNYLKKPFSFTIVAGVSNIHKSAPIEVFSKSIKIYPKFTLTKMTDDIGVIELNQILPINGKTIAIGRVRTQEIPQGTKCSVAGWGATAMKPFANLSGELYTNEVEINTDCKGFLFYDYNVTIDGSHICAASRKGSDICFQDTGSPLVCNNEIVGIANVYNDCGDNKNTGTAYLKINEYISFIKNTQLREKDRSAGISHLNLLKNMRNFLEIMKMICLFFILTCG